MNTYTITLRVQLDRAPSEGAAITIGRRWAERADTTLLGTTYSLDEPRIGVVGAFEIVDSVDRIIADLMAALVIVLDQHGHHVHGWDVIDLRTEAEARRQLDSAAVPPMVSAAELSELCGVTPARIYELESERKKAESRGERHAFPAPVVPGYWLKTMAETYAATRKRKPGPAPRSA